MGGVCKGTACVWVDVNVYVGVGVLMCALC